MNKIYGYCLFSNSESTAKKDDEYKKSLFGNSEVEFDDIFEEYLEQNKSNLYPKFDELLNLLCPNDTVIFADISCLGVNFIERLNKLDLITQEKEVSIRFLSNGMELQSSSDSFPYQWLTISNLLLIDEFNRRRISYTTKSALARKRESGVVLGRPNKSNQLKDTIISLSAQGKRGYQIAEELNISPATVSRILQEIRGKKSRFENIELVTAIKEMKLTGETLSQIAERFHISKQWVSVLRQEIEQSDS